MNQLKGHKTLDGELEQRFMNELFKPINETKPVMNFVRWVIDSKYRIKSRLDSYLVKQYMLTYHAALKIVKREGWFKLKNDIAIIKILSYVVNNYGYITDIQKFNYPEKWEDLLILLENGEGDCESQNSLIYVLALVTGIPYYLLFSSIGTSIVGGHFWLLYFSPTRAQANKEARYGLFSIDATLYPDLTPLKDRTAFKLDDKKYNDIWYVFNTHSCWKM